MDRPALYCSIYYETSLQPDPQSFHFLLFTIIQSSSDCPSSVSLSSSASFSFSLRASCRPARASKGINCFARSDLSIFPFLVSTSMPSDLLIPAHGSARLQKIPSTDQCIFPITGFHLHHRSLKPPLLIYGRELLE